MIGIGLMLVVGSLMCGAEAFSFPPDKVSKIAKTFGNDAILRIHLFEQLVNNLHDKNDFEKLLAVNNFVNQFPWVSDTYAWGKEDYWASPLEFLGRSMGDCEDYVIIKYFALRKAGVSDEKLFFTYAHANGYDKVHMVLVYYPRPDAIPLVLDNINKKILPGTHRDDLTPVYSFNAKMLFLAKKAGRGEVVPGSREQNRAWVDFLMNLEKEKL